MVEEHFGFSPELAFQDGNYAIAARLGRHDPELLGCATIMLGNPEKGIEILENAGLETERSLFFKSFGLWCLGRTSESLECVATLASATRGDDKIYRSWRELLARKTINILVMNKELSLPRKLCNGAITIVTVGYSHDNDIVIEPGADAAWVLEQLDKRKFVPDYMLVFRPEYLLLFDELETLPWPKLAFLSDYDLHLYQKYSDFIKFDKLIVYSAVDHFETNRLFGVDVYTHVFSSSLHSHRTPSPSRNREADYDIFVTGTSFRHFFADKSVLMYKISQLDDSYNIRIVDGFTTSGLYRQALYNTRITPTFVRFYGCFPTRGIEALAAGGAVLYQDGGVLEDFFVKNDDKIFPYREETLESDVEEAIERIREKANAPVAEKIARLMGYERALPMFLKFCAFISLFPKRLSAKTSTVERHDYRVVGCHDLHGGIGSGLNSWNHLINLDKIINLNRNLPFTVHSSLSIASSCLYAASFKRMGCSESLENEMSKYVKMAIDVLKKTVDRFPQRIVPIFNLARVIFHYGAFDRAEPYFKRLMEKTVDELDYLQDDLMSPLFFNEEHFVYRAYIDGIVSAERDNRQFCEALGIIKSASAHYLSLIMEQRKNIEKSIAYERSSIQIFSSNYIAQHHLSLLLYRFYKETGKKNVLPEMIQLFEQSVQLYPRYLHPGIIEYADALLTLGHEVKARSALDSWYRFFRRVREGHGVLSINRDFLEKILGFDELLPPNARLVFGVVRTAADYGRVSEMPKLAEEILLNLARNDGWLANLYRVIRSGDIVLQHRESYSALASDLIRERFVSHGIFCFCRFVWRSLVNGNGECIIEELKQFLLDLLKAVPRLDRVLRDARFHVRRIVRYCGFSGSLNLIFRWLNKA